ncbi:hypothetical protein [Histidinibacterium lentulum]|nr:hypothetical protein [Histidinibacterium lentulum]
MAAKNTKLAASQEEARTAVEGQTAALERIAAVLVTLSRSALAQ